MIKSAVIIPIGDEIASGVVLDTDSPEIMRQLLALEPAMAVSRRAPVRDEEETIAEALVRAAKEADLVILIGGSGGGHRFSRRAGTGAGGRASPHPPGGPDHLPLPHPAAGRL